MKIFKILIKDFLSIFERIISSLPNTYVFNFLRKIYYQQILNVENIKIILTGIRFECKKNITVGKNLVCASNAEVNACDSKGIFIGDNVAIGPNVYIRSANHEISNIEKPMIEQGHSFKIINHQNKDYSVVIENNVWIGAKSIILSGSKIGEGSVISAGTVVSSEIPKFSIVAGNPGRVILNRKNN